LSSSYQPFSNPEILPLLNALSALHHKIPRLRIRHNHHRPIIQHQQRQQLHLLSTGPLRDLRRNAQYRVIDAHII
ncbi:hypothetical protein M8C21_028019, partial [Ambrosia artemisiifolia]